MTPTTEYRGGIFGGEVHPNRQADVWWCDGYGDNQVGIYELNGRKAVILCLGEMLIRMTDGSLIRRAEDLPSDVVDDESYYQFLLREDIEVVNNCWLEVYEIGVVQGRDEVCGELTEALDAAFSILSAERKP